MTSPRYRISKRARLKSMKCKNAKNEIVNREVLVIQNASCFLLSHRFFSVLFKFCMFNQNDVGDGLRVWNEWMIIEFFCSANFSFRSLRSMPGGEQKLWQLINSCGFVSHSKVCLCCFCHLLQHLPSQLIFSFCNSKFLL